MAYKVIMPRLGMTMEEGTITRWMKNKGDSVEPNEPLFELETDKVATEVTSEAAGVLVEILVYEGETVPVLSTVAIIDEKVI